MIISNPIAYSGRDNLSREGEKFFIFIKLLLGLLNIEMDLSFLYHAELHQKHENLIQVLD